MITGPYITYELHKARVEDLQRAAGTFRLTPEAQGDQPNRIKALVERVVAFTKRLSSLPAQATPTSEMPQMQLSDEQA